MQKHENPVKILLEKGADPNTRDNDGRNALMVMSMEFRPVDPNLMRRRTPGAPHGGVISGNIFLVIGENDGALQLIGKTLLQAGCDINSADSKGRTPLMYAARYRRLTAVQLLLEAGANVNARDKDGMTALDLAKSWGNQEIIRLLQRAGAVPGAPKKQSGSQ